MNNLMSIYRQHYWSIYADFIDMFTQLNYKGIPLPLLCVDISRYFNEDLISLMHQPSFKSCLQNKIFYETDIQSTFNQLLSSLQKNPTKKNTQADGKILLQEFVLRFPEEAVFEHFNFEQVIYLTEGGFYVNSYGFQTCRIENFTIDSSRLVKKYIKKARRIFSSYNQHPIFGNRTFQKKFISEIPEMVDKIIAVDNFFDQIPIACAVIGAYSTILSRALIFVSRSRGIPSIWLEHGIIGAVYSIDWFPVLANKHAVYGKYEMDWYMKRGVSKEMIEITGNPLFDHIFTKKHMPKEEFNKRLGLESNLQKVLFALHSDISLDKWKVLAERLMQSQLVDIILKVHPPGSENERTLYRELSVNYPAIKFIDYWDYQINDVLSNVDVVVIDLSTVGLQAMLFNKPVVCLIDQDKYGYNYEYYNAINDFVSSDPLKAAQIIIELLKNKNIQTLNKEKREKFLSYAYPEKISGDKFVKMIYEIIQ